MGWKSVFRDNVFEGKVGIVSGGGTGIGMTIAKEMSALGCVVVIASRNKDQCEKSAKEINDYLKSEVKNSKGVVHAGPSTNIRNEQEVEDLMCWVVDKFGAINFLVNNSGGQFVCSAEDLSKKGFEAVVNTNLVGTFLMCREAYNQYMGENGGAIVNITLGNRNGMPLMSASGASRSGIENMTATLCSEWMESEVRINCVRPGIIWTESGFKNYGPAGNMFVEKLLPHQPAKRFGSPEEISSAVVWLLSDGASYVTGTTLSVDGGSAYHFLPLIEIENSTHLPVYGTLPSKAKL